MSRERELLELAKRLKGIAEDITNQNTMHWDSDGLGDGWTERAYDVSCAADFICGEMKREATSCTPA